MYMLSQISTPFRIVITETQIVMYDYIFHIVKYMIIYEVYVSVSIRKYSTKAWYFSTKLKNVNIYTMPKYFFIYTLPKIINFL